MSALFEQDQRKGNLKSPLEMLAFEADVFAVLSELTDEFRRGATQDCSPRAEVDKDAGTLVVGTFATVLKSRRSLDDLATMLLGTYNAVAAELRARRAPPDVIRGCLSVIMNSVRGRLWLR